jgi:predicted RNase H-like HicB family nuclease
MKKIIYFNVFKGESHYIAECMDLPIVTQGKTLDETIENIREAFSLHMDNENFSELCIASHPAISVNLDLGELEYA